MNPVIPAAALSTEALILYDLHNNPVNPPYHSNCGGMTSDAAWVWGQPMNHLKPVTDPFCRDSRNATWVSIFGRDEWISYLQSKGFKKEQLMLTGLNFSPDTREKYYKLGDRQVELATIRKDLALKSAWFSVTAEGDSIILHGKGYGHGVGMCQEGAMKMAEKGYVYVDILHYYFNDVTIGRIAERGQKESVTPGGLQF